MVSPPWVEDIEGAEAWALLQALRCSLPAECTYWVDCLPLLTAVGKGPASALDPKNVLARVHGLIHASLEDDAAKQVGWMPAHPTQKEVGIARRSDGELVTLLDLRGNTLADMLAKQGADTHRVPASEVARWKSLHSEVAERAIWIGVATQAANEHEEFPFKDSEASRWQADSKARARLAKKTGRSGRGRRARKEQQRNMGDNGHNPQVTTFGTKKLWKCGDCKRWARSRMQLCSGICDSSKERAWISGINPNLPTTAPVQELGKHKLCKSGPVLWCRRCGSFAENKAIGLYKDCQPPARSINTGGRWAQLQRLRAGRHPVNGMCLPPATDTLGMPVVMNFGYMRKKGNDDSPSDPNFKPYVCEDMTVPKAIANEGSGKSACEKGEAETREDPHEAGECC